MKNKRLILFSALAFGIISCGGGTTENTETETTPVTNENETRIESSTDYSAGEAIYTSTCLACHQLNGEGVPGAFPPLANSDYLLEDTDRAIKQIIEGSSEEMVVNGETYNSTMPAQKLDDQEIVDVMNYILNSWGNDGGNVSLEDVQNQKKNSE